MRCGVCGRENPPDAGFCAGCGGRLTAPQRIEERKIVSVLFADLVGFTSLSEQLDIEDVRGTLSLFHATLRRVLESFGGTVEKFIGDAVMAVFGAPIAHEDDAERAVRAGIAIRDAIADLRDDLHVRVGINTGEALVSIGTDPLSGEGMVAGDVVNTAARLQSAAPVDGVLVGESVFRGAERQILFAAHPPIDAKGKTEPVRCWIAVEPRSFAPTAMRASLPLVGRERERHRLIDAFERCRAERRVQLVTIVGVPGIGKSRLISELLAYIEADADLTRWRQGNVLSYGSGVAFFAVAQIVKQECGILESDNVDVAEAKLDAAIVALGFDGVDARWVRNQIGPLVGIRAAADGSGQTEAFAGWRMFTEAMAGESPTVIVVEDLHWADDALLDFVDGLVDRVTQVPLLVVATARPEFLERRPHWSGGKSNAPTIELGPLSSEDTTALIGELIDRSLLPEDVEAVLLERAGGNPLYTKEYVRALVERGAGTTLPETVQGIIAARLDGLSHDEKRLLQDGAVIGPTFWLGAVCTFGDRNPTATAELLHRLERKQLVHLARRSSLASEAEYSFTHALIREVAYTQLPRGVRADRHQRAAVWLKQVATDRADTAELIAHHYTTALELESALGNDTETLRPVVLAALTDAVHQAAGRHDHTAVIGYTQTALELRPNEASRTQLLVHRAIARYTNGDPDESLLLEARDAAVASGRSEDAVQLTCLLSDWAEYYTADSARSSSYDAEALRLAADLPPGPVTTLPAYTAAYRFAIVGRYDEAIALADREIARVSDAGAEAAVGLMLIWRGLARAEAGDEAGIVDMREAVDILSAQMHPKAAIAAHNLGDTLLGLGRLGEAADAFDAAIVSAHRFGNVLVESSSRQGLAQLALHRSEPASSLAWLEAISTDESEWVATLASHLRGRLVIDSAPREAADAAQEQFAYARRTGNLEQECEALALAARAELALGDTAAANNALDQYFESWVRLGGVSACAVSLVEAGLVAAACGRDEELAAAARLVRASTPWTAAARALAERRYTDAAAILDAIPSIPLRDAARRLADDH